jgi:hypothetical protein
MVDSDMGPDYEVGASPNARPFWDTAWQFMMNRRDWEDERLLDYSDRMTYNPLLPITIGAPYCGPPPHEVPYIFRWKDRQSGNPDPDFRLEIMERCDAAMRAGIEEVAALPTGLILYDARVFRVMEQANALPWFDYEYTDKYRRAKSTTEDVFQTRNASLLDMPQYVLWDSWARHYKLKGVERPVPITRDACQGVMRQALASKYESPSDKLMVVNRHDPQFHDAPGEGYPHGDLEPGPGVVAGANGVDAKDPFTDGDRWEKPRFRPGPNVVPAVGGPDPA